MLWNRPSAAQCRHRTSWPLPSLLSMKAHPAIFKQHVLDLRQKGKSARQIARETGLKLSTVVTWVHRKGHSTRHSTRQTEGKICGHSTRHSIQSGMSWQQCLHFDSAHLFREGDNKPVCADSPPGLATTPGMLWLPHDSCVRKCKRCSKWEAENETGEPAAGSPTQ